MSKFDNIPGKAMVAEVAKKSNLMAKVMQVRMIKAENIVPYPSNSEDTSDTADIRKSIGEIGFVDPIEVTAYNMPDGKYMIISGHRRYQAAVESDIDILPCIIRIIKSDAELFNNVLLANCQRDSSKDPLLYMKRCLAHEAYLESIGFEGEKAEEIAGRLGIKARQYYNYKGLSKVIQPILDMVVDGSMGVSSAVCFSSLDDEKQGEAYQEILRMQKEGNEITRKSAKQIADFCKGKTDDVSPRPDDVSLRPESDAGGSPGTSTATVAAENDSDGIELPAAGSRPEPIISAASDNSIERSEVNNAEPYDVPDKRKMKYVLGYIEKLEDIVGLDDVNWDGLRDNSEAADILTRIANVAIGLIDEITAIAKMYKLDGKDGELEAAYGRIRQRI